MRYTVLQHHLMKSGDTDSSNLGCCKDLETFASQLKFQYAICKQAQ